MQSAFSVGACLSAVLGKLFPTDRVGPPASLQISLKLQSFYNSIHVRKVTFWLSLLGTCGGAFGTFLQVMGVVSVSRELLASLKCKCT